MNLTEYKQVEKLTYREYCDYLQNKYGIGLKDYMTKSWNKNTRATRTSEGLVIHHKYEDCAIMLSNEKYARKNPFEWQLAKNLIYCDYLEHLFLHILICENPSIDKNENEIVGIGGIINFLVPELNDFYSGWEANVLWKKKCLERIRDDKEVYLILLKRFKNNCKTYPYYTEDCLFTSFNEEYGLWTREQNENLFWQIDEL